LRRRILQQPVKVLYERRDRRPLRLKLKPMLMARKTQLIDATILVEGRRSGVAKLSGDPPTARERGSNDAAANTKKGRNRQRRRTPKS